MILVVVADAIVDEYAMVVELRYAALAYATVLGTSRLQQAASMALLTGMEDVEVVRI